MFYTLYNKQLDTYLVHPQIGLWYTSDLKEAEDMLLACLEYVQSFDFVDYDCQFVIINAENYEELCQSRPPEMV